MFDGSYKQRKTISLKGRSHTESRRDVVRKARLEREQRQAQRRRLQACYDVQRWWRWISAIRSLQRERSHAYDDAMSNEESMSSSISLNEIMASLHNFTALSFKAACERADDMAKRICNAYDTEDALVGLWEGKDGVLGNSPALSRLRSQRLISVMAYKSGKSAHCFALMKSFSIAVLAKRSRFIYDEASSIPEEPKSSVFSLSSSTPTTPSTWTKQEYYSRTLDFSCELLRLLGEGMREQRVSMDESASGPNAMDVPQYAHGVFMLCNALFSLSPARNDQENGENGADSYQHCLTKKFLRTIFWNADAINGASGSFSSFHLGAVLRHLMFRLPSSVRMRDDKSAVGSASSVFDSERTKSKTDGLLISEDNDPLSDNAYSINLERLKALVRSAISFYEQQNFSAGAAALCGNIMSECLPRIVRECAGIENDDATTDVVMYDSDYSDEDEMYSEENKPLLVLSAELKRFLSPNSLRSFVDGISFDKNVDSALEDICNTFGIISQNWSQLQVDLLNGLSFYTSFVRDLWFLLKREEVFFSLARGKCAVGEIGDAYPIALLWANCYSHFLSAEDDDSFFKGEKHFKVETEIKSMVLSLKNSLFVAKEQCIIRLMFPQLQLVQSIPLPYVWRRFSLYVPLRQALVKILSQLFERNIRHCFLPMEEWNLAALDSERFLLSLDSGSSVAEEILEAAPFLIPDQTRFRVFHRRVAGERRESRNHRTRHISIRRDHLFEDAYAELSKMDLRCGFQVQFINCAGEEEAGIDGGGLFKEFMALLIKTILDPQRGLFKQTPEGEVYPNPLSGVAEENHRALFEFAGRLFAKVLYEEILVEAPLAHFFLSKILRKKRVGMSVLTDLKNFDPELYRNLLKLRDYQGNIEEEFDLCFTVMSNHLGEVEEKELLPGGSEIAVTQANLQDYIRRVAEFHVNEQTLVQTRAFKKGFFSLIRWKWINMFQESELQTLISGVRGPIDLGDWKRNTVYYGYEEDDVEIQNFWEIVSSFTPEQQRLVLKFATSAPMSPLLGFECLYPKFAIQKVATHAEAPSSALFPGFSSTSSATEESSPTHVTPSDPSSSSEASRLPTASTCFNQLKLPAYESKEEMRERLLYAITSNAGFEYS